MRNLTENARCVQLPSFQFRRAPNTFSQLDSALPEADKNVSFNPERRAPMVLDRGFVAAVLEGIEATLGELIERVESSELQSSLDVLQSRVTALRVSIEPRAKEAEGVEEAEEPVAVQAI